VLGLLTTTLAEYNAAGVSPAVMMLMLQRENCSFRAPQDMFGQVSSTNTPCKLTSGAKRPPPRALPLA